MDNILSTELIDNQQPRPLTYFGYIYMTTNLINNKKYIGMHKAKTFDKSYYGSGILLRKAIEKYGIDNFKVEILEWCLTKEDLGLKEKYYIDKYNCVLSEEFYNCMEGGFGGDNKTTLFEEDYKLYIKKISDSKKNRPRTKKEQEVLDMMHKHWTGSHHTEESKEKSRQSNLGQTRSDECKRHLSENHADFSGKNNPFYGKTHSKETIERIVMKNREHFNDPNFKKKLSEAHKGMVWITNCIDDEHLVHFNVWKDEYPTYVRGRLRKYQKK